MAILSLHHYLEMAQRFINDFTTIGESYYMYVGKPDPWLDANGNIIDSTPPAANVSLYATEGGVYHEMVFGTQVTNTEVISMIPRNTWTSNNIYYKYDQNDANLYSQPFYVVTSKNEVYKCIDNANGIPSTIEPSLNIPYGTFSTGDGYTWKYMYTVQSAANTTFNSLNYIPVTSSANVSGNATPGTIDVIRVNNGGNGYVTYSGSIQNFINNYNLVLDANASSIDNIYTGSSIYLNSGLGAGQIRQIISYTGSTRSLQVNSQFTVYNVLNIGNTSGSFNIGDQVTQTFSITSINNQTGYFSPGDTVVQSDTGATGQIATSNSSVLYIIPASGSASFSLIYPIVDTIQAGILKSGTVNVTANSAYINSVSNTAFTTNFSVGNYVSVGANSFNNVRRILAVNTTVITVDAPFNNTLSNTNVYLVPNAVEPVSISIDTTTGIISNTNLSSVILTYANTKLAAVNFILGERLDFVDASNTYLGTSGIVSFANSTTLIMSSVTGPGYSVSNSYFIYGASSLQEANITKLLNYPNITVAQPLGQYMIGQYFNSGPPNTTSINGSGTILSAATIPDKHTTYVIGPTINIAGDGTNAIAVASLTNTGAISSVSVVNPGLNYTVANVTVTANSINGSGANLYPVISPVNGHGSNAVFELGARWVGMSVTVANGSNEGYKFPVYGNYRIMGIIDTPLYNDAIVNLTSFDRTKLYTSQASNTFTVGEVVYQPTTNAAGVVVYTNNSFIELKSVLGTFIANGAYANGTAANDNVRGMHSGAVANVASANVSYFQLTSNVEFVTERTSTATADITNVISNFSDNLSVISEAS